MTDPNGNLLPTAPLVYYAEPIDRALGSTPAGYQVVRALAEYGLTTYRPATVWTGGQHNPALVERTNRDLLYRSDLVIADASTGTPSIGVWMEVEAATARGIRTVVLHDPERPRSVSLSANPLVHHVTNTKDCIGLAARLAHEHRTHSRTPDNQLKVTLVPGAQLPTRAYMDDAGIDLVCDETVRIVGGAFCDIKTTITGVQTPADTWLMVTSRSSTPRKKGLHIPVSVIDPGWRGPLMVGAWNLTMGDVTVHKGDRIGQIVAIHNRTAQLDIRLATQLAPHERGTNGFGSSGGHTPAPAAARPPVLANWGTE